MSEYCCIMATTFAWSPPWPPLATMSCNFDATVDSVATAPVSPAATTCRSVLWASPIASSKPRNISWWSVWSSSSARRLYSCTTLSAVRVSWSATELHSCWETATRVWMVNQLTFCSNETCRSTLVGRDGDSQWAGRFGFKPGGGEIFCAHWDQYGAHPLPSRVQVKERVQVYLHFPFGPSWQVIGWTLSFIVLHLKTFPLSEGAQQTHGKSPIPSQANGLDTDQNLLQKLSYKNGTNICINHICAF